MSVTEAINARRSVRGFLDKPVPKSVISEILETAARSPSGGNLQPWRVYVQTGDALSSLLAKVGARVQERGMAADGDGDLEYFIYPPDLFEPYRTHRFQVGEALYETLGIAREDKIGRLTQFAENFRFFGAPVGLFFCLDRRLGPPQWVDIGLYLQSVMLLAEERGLATCPQEAWSLWHKTVRAHCGMPDEMLVFCGLALGYADPSHPTSKLKTPRAGLDEFCEFSGFND